MRVCVGCVLGWHCRPGLTVAFLMPAIIKFVQQQQRQSQSQLLPAAGRRSQHHEPHSAVPVCAHCMHSGYFE